MLNKFLGRPFQAIGPIVSFKFWAVELAVRADRNCRPTAWTKNERHKLCFVRGIAAGELRPINGKSP